MDLQAAEHIEGVPGIRPHRGPTRGGGRKAHSLQCHDDGRGSLREAEDVVLGDEGRGHSKVLEYGTQRHQMDPIGQPIRGVLGMVSRIVQGLGVGGRVLGIGVSGGVLGMGLHPHGQDREEGQSMGMGRVGLHIKDRRETNTHVRAAMQLKGDLQLLQGKLRQLEGDASGLQ